MKNILLLVFILCAVSCTSQVPTKKNSVVGIGKSMNSINVHYQIDLINDQYIMTVTTGSRQTKRRVYITGPKTNPHWADYETGRVLVWVNNPDCFFNYSVFFNG